MNPIDHALSASLRRCALAAAVLGSAAAQAAITPPAAGGEADYGNGGNIFEIQSKLFVQGLGSADLPNHVVALNPALSWGEALSGVGTSLVTIQYQVHNSSASESFSDLRFMFFANPDGDSVNFLDTLSESWGPAAAGDPARREGRAFTFNPLNNIPSRFSLNNNLTEGATPLDAACTAAAGCDAVVALQWNAPTLGPGQTFQVRVGLSDDGQSLSSRWLRATAVDSANTALTVSGIVAVVPEPAAAWLFGGGLAMLGIAARRRRGERGGR